MPPYSFHDCKVCSLKAVGVFMTPDYDSGEWIKAYYCNKHWYGRKTQEDKLQLAREALQWSEMDWYKEAYPKKLTLEEQLAESRKKRSENSQLHLL